MLEMELAAVQLVRPLSRLCSPESLHVPAVVLPDSFAGKGLKVSRIWARSWRERRLAPVSGMRASELCGRTTLYTQMICVFELEPADPAGARVYSKNRIKIVRRCRRQSCGHRNSAVRSPAIRRTRFPCQRICSQRPSAPA